jgi:hypothetical protein
MSGKSALQTKPVIYFSAQLLIQIFFFRSDINNYRFTLEAQGERLEGYRYCKPILLKFRTFQQTLDNLSDITFHEYPLNGRTDGRCDFHPQPSATRNVLKTSPRYGKHRVSSTTILYLSVKRLLPAPLPEVEY